MGRSKNFDQLVAELKTKVRDKGSQALEGCSSAGRSPSPETYREPAGSPHCRRPLANLPAFRSVSLTCSNHFLFRSSGMEDVTSWSDHY